MIRSIISWEVAEEANEKVFPSSLAESSSSSPATFSGIADFGMIEEEEGVSAFET